MAGNLVVTDGDLFAKTDQSHRNWVDGRRFELDKPPVTDPAARGSLKPTGDDGRVLKLNLKITGTRTATQRHAQQAS